VLVDRPRQHLPVSGVVHVEKMLVRIEGEVIGPDRLAGFATPAPVP